MVPRPDLFSVLALLGQFAVVSKPAKLSLT